MQIFLMFSREITAMPSENPEVSTGGLEPMLTTRDDHRVQIVAELKNIAAGNPKALEASYARCEPTFRSMCHGSACATGLGMTAFLMHLVCVLWAFWLLVYTPLVRKMYRASTKHLK
jgi:hypothetical protein